MRRLRRDVCGVRLSICVAALFIGWIGCAPAPSPRGAEEAPEVVRPEHEASDVDYAQAYFDLGMEYYDQGRYAEAIDQYRLSLGINPYNDEAHAAIGMANYHLGKKELAESSFRRALQFNPRNVLARNGIALVSNDERERATALEIAISYTPEMPELRNNLCYIYAQGGNYERAVEECQASVRLDSTNANAHYNLGYALQRQGRLDVALHHYEAALRYHPEWARVLNNMGLVYYYKSDFARAVERYEEAIAAEGTDAVFHYNLALAYEAMARRIQAAQQRGEGGSLFGVGNTSDWRALYRAAANELRTYLNMQPDAADANRVYGKINELRRRAS